MDLKTWRRTGYWLLVGCGFSATTVFLLDSCTAPLWAHIFLSVAGIVILVMAFFTAHRLYNARKWR
jgi:cell division protein FtsW (lipid II flippase)